MDDLARVWLAAQVSSRIRSSEFLPKYSISPDFAWCVDQLVGLLPEAAGKLRTALQTGGWPDRNSQSHHVQWGSQSFWADALVRRARALFDGNAPPRLVDLRTMQKAPCAGEWITARPGFSTVVFSNSEWKSLLGMRLGFEGRSELGTCAGCGSTPLGPLTDHAISCHPCGLYHRHNLVRDTVAEMCREAGWHTQLEVGLPVPPDPGKEALRPADILITNYGAKPVALDVGVSYPLRPSAPSSIRSTAGESAVRHETSKREKNLDACNKVQWLYKPLCFEAGGGWGPAAQAFLKRVAKITAIRQGRDALTVFNEIAARVSLALAKGVAGMLVKAMA